MIAKKNYLAVMACWMLLAGLVLSACAVNEVAAAGKQAEIEGNYQTVTLPDPNGIQFELPEEWAFWGNAGYLSPDDGTTLAGIRLAWIQEGVASEKYLYNEDSIVHENSAQNVAGIDTRRMIVESTLKKAESEEVIWHAYELIYAFPSPDNTMMIGAIVSAPTKEDLVPLEGVAEHMVASLTWQGMTQ
jgi:hypothetical protein